MAIVKRIRFGLKRQPISEFMKYPDWVPLNGEVTYISDLEDYEVAWKVGDGSTKWVDLPYVYKYKKDRIVYTNKVLKVDSNGNVTFEAAVPYNPKYAVVEVKQLKDFITGKDLEKPITIDTGVQILRSYNADDTGSIICKFNGDTLGVKEIAANSIEFTIVPE